MPNEMNDLVFGEFTLDCHLRQLRRGQELVAVSGKAFDLLAYMAANSGRPLLKAELLQAVWPDSFVEESNLSQNVFLLRKALGTAGGATIQTLPGRGYQFTAKVTQTELLPPQPPAPDVLPTTLELSATRTRILYDEQTEEHVGFWRSPMVLGLGLLLLLTLGVAGRLGWQRWEDRVGGPPVQVVMALADGTTGDPVLDRTLAAAMRIELAQSPFINLVPGSTVQAKLVQMEHKPDEKLTLPLAREVCERTGSQAVVHGSVARAGAAYLLTEEAVNCFDGVTLGAASQSVSRPEELPRALSRMAADLRHSLGESRRTIARFASPLSPATTASLEALKDFTEAERVGSQGHFAESQDLLKKAVALDPNFAAAWVDLSTYAYNDQDRQEGAVYLQKAYDLRDHSTAPMRLYIAARYTSEITGDLYEGVRNDQSWTEIYPRSGQPWSALAVVYRDLGNTAEQLAAARKTMERLPTYYVVHQALADAQTRSQDYAGARATCDAAVARGLDGDAMREIMLRLGHLQHDPSYIAQQEAWAREHPDSPFVHANEAYFAIGQGQTRESMKLLQQMREVTGHSGQHELEASLVAGQASYLARLGEVAEAQRLLATVPPSATYDYMLATIDVKDDGKVEAMLADQLNAQPHATLWNEWYGPILRGNLLLKAHKPQEALAALEPARRFDGKDFDALYTRGLAYMAVDQLPQAEAELQTILAHPERNPASPQLSLARVQLARVLVRQGRKQEAARAYDTFLTDWSKADEGQPLLVQVQKERKALSL